MTTTSDYSRDRQWDRLTSAERPWDVAVIGGGATGVGIAVDAAGRGYRVALCERFDFGKGTSSRSTKLIHGGVRYLQQGRIGLVRESLRERGLLRVNAPHLVWPLPTIVPLYAWWERPYYGLGLKVYDWLSGRLSLGPSRRLSAAETLERVPTVQPHGLRGGILYWDGQFDDTRLLVNLVQTAIDCGAVCVNYAPVRELVKEAGRVCGFITEDAETGRTVRVDAQVVVNATGPFSDFVRRLEDPAAEAVIAASQGVHLMFAGSFLPGETALVVPRTLDGRVVFAIPWHGHTMVGTTDTPVEEAPTEPRALPDEIEFLLETVAPYLTPSPQAEDIRSVWAGIRPLVRVGGSGGKVKTSKLGRDHVIRVSPSGLVSIMGGKWTTYRKMAEDCVDRAAEVGGLAPAECVTKTLAIHGAKPQADNGAQEAGGDLADCGSDAEEIERIMASQPEWGERLSDELPHRVGQVIWAARHEMARTVEDVLARRLRMLFLDASAALGAAPRVAELLAAELGRDAAWQAEQVKSFKHIAETYLPTNVES